MRSGLRFKAAANRDSYGTGTACARPPTALKAIADSIDGALREKLLAPRLACKCQLTSAESGVLRVK